MTIGPIKIQNPSDVKRALVDRTTANTYGDEWPLLECPGCGLLVPDFDGFGILAHLDPPPEAKLENFPSACGYCRHPSADGNDKGEMVCTLCGAVKGSEEWSNRKARREPKL